MYLILDGRESGLSEADIVYAAIGKDCVVVTQSIDRSIGAFIDIIL